MNVFLRPLAAAHNECLLVTSPRISVGRGEGCELRLQNGMVSRRHAELIVRDDAVQIRDLESSNGTFVNGEPVEGLRRLRDGDVVSFAVVPYEVQINRDVKSRIRLLSASSAGETIG